MEQRIKELEGHYIICGYGRTGRAVGDTLTGAHYQYVVVENLPATVHDLQEHNILVVEGDASQDDTLQRAGIERANGLVAALGGDAENVYLVLSARQMNPKLNIVSWATSEEAEKKVKRAGADHVMSPYALGGKRIATLLTTPHALEFFDYALFGERAEIRLGEVEISATSTLAGNSLKGIGINRDLGIIVIGIRHPNGNMHFNPSGETTINEKDVLICIGSQKQMDVFKGMVG